MPQKFTVHVFLNVWQTHGVKIMLCELICKRIFVIYKSNPKQFLFATIALLCSGAVGERELHTRLEK